MVPSGTITNIIFSYLIIEVLKCSVYQGFRISFKNVKKKSLLMSSLIYESVSDEQICEKYTEIFYLVLWVSVIDKVHKTDIKETKKLVTDTYIRLPVHSEVMITGGGDPGGRAECWRMLGSCGRRLHLRPTDPTLKCSPPPHLFNCPSGAELT